VTRKAKDGRIAIVEKTIVTEKRLTKLEQRAQAQHMMMRRLFGGKDASVKGLAEEFDLVPATISKRLALARTDGVPDEARQIFIQEMLPAAMAVVQEVMAGEDRKLAFAAAKMVIEGLDAIGQPQVGVSDGKTVVEESFEAWRTRVTRRVSGIHSEGIEAGPSSPPAEGSENRPEPLPVLEGITI